MAAGTTHFDRSLVFGITEQARMGVIQGENVSVTLSDSLANIVMLILSDGVAVEEILPAQIAELDQLCINDECWPYAWGGLRTKHLTDERYSGRRTYPKV